MEIPEQEGRQECTVSVIEEDSGKELDSYARCNRPTNCWDSFANMDELLSYFENRRFAFDFFRDLPRPRIAQATDETTTAFNIFELVSDSKSDHRALRAPSADGQHDDQSAIPPLAILSIQVTALPVGHADNSTEDALLRLTSEVCVTNTEAFRTFTCTLHA